MKVHKVKNLTTGLVHTVNDGHFALDHPDYEAVKPKPKPKAKK